MSVLSLNNIEKYYGIQQVLKDFSLFATEGERIGLIGANGCGKTTVFKVIAGMESFSGGNMSIKREARIGYLSQMPDFSPDNTLYEELITVFDHLVKLEDRLRELEQKISITGKNNKNKDNKLSRLMTEYSELQHNFEINGGYQYESQIRQVATGMGFSQQELQKKVDTLSGGEKTRLGLVKLLLSGPEVLLLDEPTNHLDISSIQWLEDYLKDYGGTVLIISHDRYFLDQVITRIVELKDGREEVYHGNYSYYLEERKARYEQLLREYENQQKKIKKMEEAIKRLHQWGQQGDNEKFFKRARSMQKSLDRIDRMDKPVLNKKQMGLELEIDNRSGREVLRIRNLEKSFNTNPLLKDLDLDVYWGEKVAIIGKNGSGKTTLIKTIINKITPDQGEIKIGANVSIGYYSQEFEGFKADDDLVTAMCRESSMKTGEARDALAAFLFTEDEVFKKVSSLSGGEKSRLRLLQLMNGNYNFLIMDEPTNHLDLPSREVLEEALEQYPGTVLVISHDRYFLNKLIDYTYELEDGSLTKYYGNYEYYRKKKEELCKIGQLKPEESEGEQQKQKSEYHRLKEKQREERRRENRIKELEESIGELEKIRQELEREMARPDNLDDFILLNKLKNRYDETGQKLNKLYSEWEDVITLEG